MPVGREIGGGRADMRLLAGAQFRQFSRADLGFCPDTRKIGDGENAGFRRHALTHREMLIDDRAGNRRAQLELPNAPVMYRKVAKRA